MFNAVLKWMKHEPWLEKMQMRYGWYIIDGGWIKFHVFQTCVLAVFSDGRVVETTYVAGIRFSERAS